MKKIDGKSALNAHDHANLAAKLNTASDNLAHIIARLEMAPGRRCRQAIENAGQALYYITTLRRQLDAMHFDLCGDNSIFSTPYYDNDGEGTTRQNRRISQKFAPSRLDN